MKGIYDYFFPYKINLDSLNGIHSEEEIMNIISSSIFFNNIKKKKDILEKAKQGSKTAIYSCTLLGGLVGLVNVFPCTDLPILLSIEFSLVATIITKYGLKRSTSEITQIIKESTKSGLKVASIAYIGYNLGNSLKLIPIIGPPLGGIIDGAVASISINRIGEYTIDYCEKLFHQDILIDYLKNAINSINMGVDELLNISKKFKK